MNEFATDLARNIFYHKYALTQADTWHERCRAIVHDVCDGLMSKDDIDQLIEFMRQFKVLPGGRYIYYGGRKAKFWNNCYLLRAEEDTREEWGRLDKRASDCLMTGGGIGVDYSVYRPRGQVLSRTGGTSSGPLPAMYTLNEIGRYVMQGGSRRSALWAGLNWQHEDIQEFLHAKDWADMPAGTTGLTYADLKEQDFNFPAPLDMTNISVLYDDDWLRRSDRAQDPVFVENVRQALRNGEPGFAFNFGSQSRETLRNACTEVTSEDDSDVCNLVPANLARIESATELRDVCELASKFQICATLRADVPYEKVRTVRDKNRRLGLGIMGVHAWQLQRGLPYGKSVELGNWLASYVEGSERGGYGHADQLGVSRPVALRAIAPTGTIGILASTTTGIEPLFAVAYKRRYLTNGTDWKYEYCIDATAQHIIDETGCDPDTIEDATTLAADPERRVAFQAWVQQYVDMGISSTINVERWSGSDEDEARVKRFAECIARHAPGLRGLTVYPDGSRGGQPLVRVPYRDAVQHRGVTFEDNSESACKGGVCGV